MRQLWFTVGTGVVVTAGVPLACGVVPAPGAAHLPTSAPAGITQRPDSQVLPTVHTPSRDFGAVVPVGVVVFRGAVVAEGRGVPDGLLVGSGCLDVQTYAPLASCSLPSGQLRHELDAAGPGLHALPGATASLASLPLFTQKYP